MPITPLQATDVANPAALNSRLAIIEALLLAGGSSPPGFLMHYAGSSAPTGWLLCNGAAVSRSTYAALFAIIGTTFGVGDGSTTFNLPDTRGRTPIGAGTGAGLSARSMGQTMGEENHQLTIPELAAHTHPLSGVSLAAGVALASANPTVTGATSGSTGSDTPHNTMQPSLVLNTIIKT